VDQLEIECGAFFFGHDYDCLEKVFFSFDTDVVAIAVFVAEGRRARVCTRRNHGTEAFHGQLLRIIHAVAVAFAIQPMSNLDDEVAGS